MQIKGIDHKIRQKHAFAGLQRYVYKNYLFKDEQKVDKKIIFFEKCITRLKKNYFILPNFIHVCHFNLYSD